MSKALYVCYRKKHVSSDDEEKIRIIMDQINADNISPNPTVTFSKNKIIYGISNPVGSITTNDENILLGKLLKKDDNWQSIRNDYPDGNYGIFRSDENYLEILTDLLGTRTIWYYKDEEKFISSTSQRAIIKFIGDFQFDKRIIPWVISSGSLGPLYSWDKRIKRVQPGSLFLDLNSWNLERSINPVDFSPINISDADHEVFLRKTLHKTFDSLDLDFSKWALSLSGGHDCRGILEMLNKTKETPGDIKTVTWGIKDSEKKKNTDGYIANEVSKTFNTQHTYLHTDSPSEPLEKILLRFLKNGEGRIDHFSGYTDGFQIWKTLFENHIEGMVRGNQIFGQKVPQSSLAVKNIIGINLCSDFKNLQKFEYLKSLKQDLPFNLQQKENESLSSWRDRLLQEYRLPVIQAALSDLKYPYVEQFDPLLSQDIVKQVRTMPDHLRDNKNLFQKIIKSMNPGLKFANKSATRDKKQIFAKKDFIELMKKELSSKNAHDIFPPDFLQQIIDLIKEESQENRISLLSLKKFISSHLPLGLKKKIIHRKIMAPTLNIYTLAFRLTLISKMNKIFNEDISDSQKASLLVKRS